MTSALYGLLKLAAPKHQEKLDLHFGKPRDAKRWADFRKELNSKGFVKTVLDDDRADEKLRTYAIMVHLHKTGKGPSYPVKGDSGKTYRVKFHPGHEIYSCSCPDWTIKKSQTAGDCKHIAQVKSQLSMVKKASFALRELAGLGRAGLQVYRNETNDEGAWHAGQVAHIHKNIAKERKLKRII